MIPKKAGKQIVEAVGKENYRTLIEDRVTYAYDASKHRRTPEAVVFPECVEQVSRVLAVCNAHKIPVVPRGAGTGLTGGAVPIAAGIVMAMKHFNRIIAVDTDNFLAVVEPGVTTSELHKAVEKEGLFYPPDPASMVFSSIGGNIAENAGGMRAVKYGVTKNYVMGLEVVLPNGDVIHTGSKCVKDVVGYDLTGLFVGSEGTLGVVTKAILKLLPKPEASKTLMAIFPSIETAAKTIPAVLQNGIIPTTLEFMDSYCMNAVAGLIDIDLPSGSGALLLIEVDGKPAEIEKDIGRIGDVCRAHKALDIKISSDLESRDNLWHARRALHTALNKIKTDWEEEDISVPISQIPGIIRDFEEISQKHAVIIASFGHAGDGNIHVSIASRHEGASRQSVFEARDEILKKTVAREGRIAAEHGIGLAKRSKITWNIDQSTLGLMHAIKRLLDPGGILNPEKVFPPRENGQGTSGQ